MKYCNNVGVSDEDGVTLKKADMLETADCEAAKRLAVLMGQKHTDHAFAAEWPNTKVRVKTQIGSKRSSVTGEMKRIYIRECPQSGKKTCSSTNHTSHQNTVCVVLIFSRCSRTQCQRQNAGLGPS